MILPRSLSIFALLPTISIPTVADLLPAVQQHRPTFRPVHHKKIRTLRYKLFLHPFWPFISFFSFIRESPFPILYATDYRPTISYSHTDRLMPFRCSEIFMLWPVAYAPLLNTKQQQELERVSKCRSNNGRMDLLSPTNFLPSSSCTKSLFPLFLDQATKSKHFP
jgi:hypothetical protein